MLRALRFALLPVLASGLVLSASDKPLSFAIKGTFGLTTGELKDELNVKGFLGAAGEVAYKFGPGSVVGELGMISIQGDDQYIGSSLTNRKVEGLVGRLGYRYPVTKLGAFPIDLQGGVAFENLKTTQEVTLSTAAKYSWEDTKNGAGLWLGVHSQVHKHVALEVNVATVGFDSRPLYSNGALKGNMDEMRGLAVEFSVGFVF